MIEDGSFQKNEVLCKVLKETVEGTGRLHLIGCLTNSREESYGLYVLLDVGTWVICTLSWTVRRRLESHSVSFTAFSTEKMFRLERGIGEEV